MTSITFLLLKDRFSLKQRFVSLERNLVCDILKLTQGFVFLNKRNLGFVWLLMQFSCACQFNVMRSFNFLEGLAGKTHVTLSLNWMFRKTPSCAKVTESVKGLSA